MSFAVCFYWQWSGNNGKCSFNLGLSESLLEAHSIFFSGKASFSLLSILILYQVVFFKLNKPHPSFSEEVELFLEDVAGNDVV